MAYCRVACSASAPTTTLSPALIAYLISTPVLILLRACAAFTKRVPCRPKVSGNAGLGGNMASRTVDRRAWALAEASPLAQALLGATSDCVKLLDLEGHLLAMNAPGMCAMEIDSFCAFDGARWSSLWPLAAQADVEHSVSVAARGQTARFAAACPTAKGRLKHWEVTVAPVPGPGGQPDLLVAISRDVTALHQAQERLEEESEFHHEAIENNPHMFWVADAAGRVLRTNRARLQFLGHSHVAATGDGWLGYLHPDDEASYRQRARVASVAREPFDVTCRFRDTRGEYRWTRHRAYPKVDDRGQIVRWYGYSEDVDEAVRAVEALDRSEERLRLVTAAAGIGTYDVGPDGAALCSPRYLDMYGLPRDTAALSFERWMSLVHPDDRQWVKDRSFSALRSGKRLDYEFRIVRADTGEVRWIDNRGKIRLDEAGKPVRSYGAQWDITSRKEAEAELERLQARSLKMTRLNSAGALASTIAHEINQPLTTIANYTSAAARMAERLDGAGGLVGVLRDVSHEAVRAGDIIRKLRRFLARGEVEQQRSSVEALVRNAARLALGERVSSKALQVEIAPTADDVDVDPVQLEQILANLLRNAAEATAGVPEPVIRVRARPHGADRTCICVEDNGPGVAQEADLFSPFVSTKVDGLGVGLAIARTIIEGHGGRIWHEARAEGGAVFLLTVPRYQLGDQEALLI